MRSYSLILVGVLPALLAACSSDPTLIGDPDLSGGKADNLSASDIRSLGTIGYGNTQLFDYTSPPKYSAIEITGAQGDQFQLDLNTIDEQDAATAWLLDPNMSLIKPSSSKRTGNPLMQQYALPEAGTYLLAFAEVFGKPATVRLSVSALVCGAVATCADDQQWSAQSCSCLAKPPVRKACTIDLDCDVPTGFCCHLDDSCHTNPAVKFDPCLP